MTTSASRSDWKFAASSRKITTMATASPTARFAERLAHRRRSGRARVTLAPRGGAPARAIAAIDRRPRRGRDRRPTIFADSVTIRWPLKRSYSPTIVRVLDPRHVAEQRRATRAPALTGTTRRSSSVVIRGCGICTCTWKAMPVRGSAQ